jgi:hypothetical protein
MSSVRLVGIGLRTRVTVLASDLHQRGGVKLMEISSGAWGRVEDVSLGFL